MFAATARNLSVTCPELSFKIVLSSRSPMYYKRLPSTMNRTKPLLAFHSFPSSSPRQSNSAISMKTCVVNDETYLVTGHSWVPRHFLEGRQCSIFFAMAVHDPGHHWPVWLRATEHNDIPGSVVSLRTLLLSCSCCYS